MLRQERAAPCQGKVEMSYSEQSRNVRFWRVRQRGRGSVDSILREVALLGRFKAEATGLAPKQSAANPQSNRAVHDSNPFWGFCFWNPPALVKSRSGGLEYRKREAAGPVLPGFPFSDLVLMPPAPGCAHRSRALPARPWDFGADRSACTNRWRLVSARACAVWVPQTLAPRLSWRVRAA